MPLADAYPLIKAGHIGLAMASGGLFACRGVGVLLGASLPMSTPVRRLSQVVDTALLLAALLLLAILQLNPFTTPWLQAKLIFLLAYIVFGSLALKRAPSRVGKRLAFGAALTCFAMIVVIARTHDPLGLGAQPGPSLPAAGSGTTTSLPAVSARQEGMGVAKRMQPGYSQRC